MENIYGIGVTNRYALFLSEEDPLEKLKAKEKAKEAKKKKLQASSAEKENKGVKTVVPKDKPLKVNGINNNQNLKSDTKPKDDAAGKPKKIEKAKFEEKKPVQIDASKDNETENITQNRRENVYSDDKEKRFNGEFRAPRGDREQREDGERYGRGGSGGSRPPRGRGGRGGGVGGGRGGDFRGKREFDRQSGSDKTGIKPNPKRNGAGPHNWGTDRDEIEEQIQGSGTNDTSGDWGDQSKANDSAATFDSNGEKKDEPTVDAPEPAEEQAKEITLDEWKASRGVKLLKPQYNLRKAGEGEDLTQWQNMYELKKKKEAKDAADQLNEEEKANELAAKAPKKKEILDTNFHFADQPSRGGRGKGRMGMRGRGGGERDRSFRDRGPREKRDFSRGGNSTNVPKVDVNNEQDFPSLG